MSAAPPVSVVMPVFNGERFVVEAVRSILAQTYRDFECIVVDDGSTDRTAEFLAAEQARDSRLRVHRQPSNQGFRVALNTGCELARGEFIARMDADDVSLPERLERQVRFLAANPGIGVVGSAVQVIDGDGHPGRVKRYPAGSGLAAWSMLFFNSLAHPAVMMRRAALEGAGFYPSGCSGGTEDYALFLAISRATRLANLDEVLLQYRVWGGNMTKIKWEAQENDVVRLLRAFLADTFDFELSPDGAAILRGLSRDQYPSDPDQIARVAGIIQWLANAYAARFSDSPSDAADIRRDAGTRLWLLSALALKRSPAVSAAVASRALSTSPASLMTFVGKAGRRLAGRG